MVEEEEKREEEVDEEKEEVVDCPGHVQQSAPHWAELTSASVQQTVFRFTGDTLQQATAGCNQNCLKPVLKPVLS